MLRSISRNNIRTVCSICRSDLVSRRLASQKIENKYSEGEKLKILEVINKLDATNLAKYDVTKARSKHISQYISTYGPIKNIIDIETIEGFTEKHAQKLFDSIIHEKVKPDKDTKVLKQIKGQILNPTLTEATRQATNSVLTVYVTVNSVSWALIHKNNYELVDWQYHGIEYPENKRFKLSDILEIAWEITNKLPLADLYVMKAEATSLRASGSDPNNPKVLAVNLQKAQMVSMIIALISTRNNGQKEEESECKEEMKKFKQNIYFLRSSLPFRLYGTLIGNERVASDQTVEMLLQEVHEKSSDNSHVFVPENLKSSFRSQKDLPKDMMAQCLLFALTFMDLCIYKNKDKIEKLLSKKGD